MRASFLVILLLAQAVVGTQAAAAKPKVVARPRAVVPLPAPIEDVVVGGSGQYLIVKLKDRRQLHVIDIVGKKVVKVLPVDDDLVKFAAGATKLVVLHMSQGVVCRYQLGSWERDLVASTAYPYSQFVMGCAAEGPIYAGSVPYYGTTVAQFLDLKTLQEISIPIGSLPSIRQNVYASADGKFFGSSGPSFVGRLDGFHLAKLEGQNLQTRYVERAKGVVQPGPDGRVVYTSYGMYDSNLQPCNHEDAGGLSGIFVPGVSGRYYLMVKFPDMWRDAGGARATFHLEGSYVPIVTVEGLALPDIPMNYRQGGVDDAPLPLHRRIYYVPNADAVITIPMSFDRVVIERINMMEELERRDPDYLVVATASPRRSERGKEMKHQIEVLSKHGGLVYELENAPRGMQVDSDGLVTWTPPLELERPSVDCQFKVRDKLGKSVRQVVSILHFKPQATSATK